MGFCVTRKEDVDGGEQMGAGFCLRVITLNSGVAAQEVEEGTVRQRRGVSEASAFQSLYAVSRLVSPLSY